MQISKWLMAVDRCLHPSSSKAHWAFSKKLLMYALLPCLPKGTAWIQPTLLMMFQAEPIACRHNLWETCIWTYGIKARNRPQTSLTCQIHFGYALLVTCSWQSGFSLRSVDQLLVYQICGRRPNSAPYKGVGFLFVLCCDHAGTTRASQPFNFNAVVMSLLWIVYCFCIYDFMKTIRHPMYLVYIST